MSRPCRPERGREVIAARALLAVLLPSIAAQSVAQTPATDPAAQQLPEQVVTATRLPTRADESIVDVNVIDRAEIERSGTRSLGSLVASRPGVQFSRNGGLGQTSSLFIRGLEARHTLLLVDGVPVGSATVGTPSFENLPLESIDRIEIARGPLSALYGSAAVGGVVQLFTRRARSVGWSPSGSVSVGSRGYRQLAGSVAFKGESVDGIASLQRTDARGFSATNPDVPFGSYNADDDRFGQSGGTLALGVQANPDWRVDGLLLESAGRADYDDGPGVDAEAKLRTSIQSLQARGRIGPRWHTRIALSRSLDRYDTLSSASAFATLGAIETDQRQLTWENGVTTPLGTLLALVERIDQTVSRPGDAFAVSDRSIDAVGVGLDGSHRRHSWQASLRHDRNSQFGGQTTGALGYGYEIAPTWRVGGSYGTSFVAPSFNQLYFPGFGNPSLQPEEGKHRELFVRYGDARRSVRATWFDSRIRGYIPSGPLPTNIPRSRVDGFSLAYDADLGPWIVAASYERIDPRNDTAGTPNAGRQLPRRARDAFRAGLDRRIGSWTAGGAVRAFSSRFDDAANTRELGGFAVLDLRAEWAPSRDWRVALHADNVADRRYETAFGYNQPGREIYLTLRWTPQAAPR